jgi:hypothetical protein
VVDLSEEMRDANQQFVHLETMEISGIRTTLRKPRELGYGGAPHMPSTMKSANVYLRKGAYLLHPLAGSGGGDPCLFSEPVIKLAPGAAPAQIGEAVMTALRASRRDAPWPTEWKGLVKPLHDAAGVRSESTFRKGLLDVRVDLTGHVLKLTPTTSKGPDRGSSPILEKIITTDLTDATALGSAVIHALSLSD